MLNYITNMSLDGYIADEHGSFNFENPEALHPFIIELLQPVGTYLYGRRLYELMAYWDGPVESYRPEHRPFARVWHTARKVVYSRTLEDVTTRNTHLERNFVPDEIRKLKRDSGHDITIGGAELAALAINADLVDEFQLFLHPVILGGGKPAFRRALRPQLELIETRLFETGVVFLRYRASPARQQALGKRHAIASEKQTM